MLGKDASHAKSIEMTLSSLLSKERVISNVAATEQCQVIAELVDHLVATASLPEASRDSVLSALKEREEDRSTGIGNGVAIPHCFSEDIEEVALIFGRSEPGIDFFAIDRAPVHFVVLFIVPKSQYALHLKTLAAIAKIMNSAGTREALTNAASSDEILDILTQKTTQV